MHVGQRFRRGAVEVQPGLAARRIDGGDGRSRQSDVVALDEEQAQVFRLAIAGRRIRRQAVQKLSRAAA